MAKKIKHLVLLLICLCQPPPTPPFLPNSKAFKQIASRESQSCRALGDCAQSECFAFFVLFGFFCAAVSVSPFSRYKCAGAGDWKPGSHRVGAGERCPETSRSAARLTEAAGERNVDTATSSASSYSSSSSAALPAAWFSADRACEYVTRFYPSLFFFSPPPRTLPCNSPHPHPRSMRLCTTVLPPPQGPLRRLAYSRCTLQIDTHTKNTHQLRAFKHFKVRN